MQDSLAAALAASRAIDTEIAGYFTRDGTGKYWFYRGVLVDAFTDNCSYKMADFTYPGTHSLVGYWHTHPDADGTTVTCRRSNSIFTIENARRGGGSPEDWEAATTLDKPMYTIDPNAIYRLDPGVPEGARSNNPFAWDRGTSTCVTKRIA